jgi:hypothetical protein
LQHRRSGRPKFQPHQRLQHRHGPRDPL